MTGAYLFGKDKDGKRVPIEIEHLTKEEREASMKGNTKEELINWIDMLCKHIRTTEHWLNTLEYEDENTKKTFFEHQQQIIGEK